jgi:hypothetical protein
MITTFLLRKYFYSAILFFSCAATVCAQDGLRVDMAGLRFSMVNLSANYSSLTVSYTDQASQPHHIYHPFSLDKVGPMYGGEIRYGAFRLKEGRHHKKGRAYIDGASIGWHQNRVSSFFHFYTGMGREYIINDGDWSIIPTLGAGISQMRYELGSYKSTNGLPLNVKGKDFSQDFTLQLQHLSMIVVPKISLVYPISFTFNLNFSVAWRLNVVSQETLLFIADSYSKNGKYANDSVKKGVQENGQYITGKCFNTSGLNLAAGMVWYFGD